MPLPALLRFLAPGWWVVHVAAVWIAYRYGYVHGKGEERRATRARELEPRK